MNKTVGRSILLLVAVVLFCSARMKPFSFFLILDLDRNDIIIKIMHYNQMLSSKKTLCRKFVRVSAFQIEIFSFFGRGKYQESNLRPCS